jgi:hypothetical protein
MLLGIPGDNTYANFQEANRALWRQTVLPLVTRTAKALAAWLAPEEGLELRPDLDAVEALSPEREALWSRLEAASFLSTAEKRAAAGYGEVGDDDPSAKAGFNTSQPRDDHGRWTGDGGTEVVLAAEPGRRRAGLLDPIIEARLAAAEANARLLERTVRRLDPTWRPQPSAHPNPPNIEGRIRENESIAAAAEARLAELLRGAIPGFNPVWGFNRLRSELYAAGFRLERATDAPGFLYTHPTTGAKVRIMNRPPYRRRSDPPEKFYFNYYYRFQSGPGLPELPHVPIPD